MYKVGLVQTPYSEYRRTRSCNPGSYCTPQVKPISRSSHFPTILSKESTCIHFVADHFSPSSTGHPAWRLPGSGTALGRRLKNRSASPLRGFTFVFAHLKDLVVHTQINLYLSRQTYVEETPACMILYKENIGKPWWDFAALTGILYSKRKTNKPWEFDDNEEVKKVEA
ncbi:dickkopf-related protein 1 [Striga asiatica]|uniref:Dickkopf-related protein 1 n=1 Tax=Striga asiatica TaxID=4170 RepID=A0A5A7PBW7_STRAF|nr:dickkopf-related protein 1 [Striga asiatica]